MKKLFVLILFGFVSCSNLIEDLKKEVEEEIFMEMGIDVSKRKVEYSEGEIIDYFTNTFDSVELRLVEDTDFGNRILETSTLIIFDDSLKKYKPFACYSSFPYAVDSVLNLLHQVSYKNRYEDYTDSSYFAELSKSKLLKESKKTNHKNYEYYVFLYTAQFMDGMNNLKLKETVRYYEKDESVKLYLVSVDRIRTSP